MYKRVLLVLILGLIAASESFSQKAYGDGTILRRFVKSTAFLYHYGIVYQGSVVHYDQDGLHTSTLEQFSGGMDVKIIRRSMQGRELAELKNRMKQVKAKYKKAKYDVMNNNCEHFAMELAFGIKKSAQSTVAAEYFSTVWPIEKAKMLKAHPKAGAYLDLVDAYLVKREIVKDIKH